MIDTTKPSTLYAGTKNGVFKSTDGGGDWSAVNTGLPTNTFVNALAIDLWSYSIDDESADAELTYQIAYVSDWHCGISLDGHWVNIAPQPNWLGICDATVRVSDSIKTADDTFRVSVVPVAARIYLPFIRK